MYTKLITLIIIASSLCAQAQEKKFSQSSAWLKLLHYQKKITGYKSKASRPEFFLSKSGQIDPHNELLETLKVFRSPHKKGLHPACRFPARFKLLNKNFKGLISAKDCPSLNTWLKGIDAGDLYLVFSSAYPSNPASLFGHTFLRFDRKSQSNTLQAKKLLGYSLAFQAQIDQNDNSFLYTYKGIAGGYQSYLEIKPHYMDVGIYNNSESRDLWEYPIPLNDNEKEMLLLHTWEIITGTTFPYYFLDENCSTLVLELLEAAKPDWNFSSKSDMFVVPQVTLKDIVAKTNNKNTSFRPAIKRIIWKRFQNLNQEQIQNVLKARNDLSVIDNLNSIDELDLLIDLWKLDNYKQTTTMSAESKNKMNATLLRRSQLEGVSSNYSLFKENEKRAPHLGHNFKSISLRWERDFKLQLAYGFHNFDDPIQGHDEKSYIDFLDLETSFSDDKLKVTNFKLVEILSLQNFSLYYPHISWNIKLWSDQEDDTDTFTRRINTTGGIGLSKLSDTWQLYIMTNLKMSNFTKRKHNIFGPLLRIGFKKSFSQKLLYINEIEAEKMAHRESINIDSKLSYQFSRNTRLLLGIKYNSLNTRLQSSAELEFYF